MKFLIARPDRHIDLYGDDAGMVYSDVAKLYEVLPEILDDMNIEYKMLYIKKDVRRIHQEPNSIYLAWHNHGTLPNIWHLKTAYMPNYFYFDKTGYGPWSEITDKCDYNMPVELIRKDVEKFCKEYIDNNESRVRQPKSVHGLPEEPYVLVLGQRPDDAVSEFAYIDTNSLMHKVSDLYKGTKYKVVTRGHPLDSSKSYGTPYDLQATGNIHDCIAGASAVYTVNSGTGFEALLHGKRVFTSGVCDYRWATTEIKTDDDLKRSIDLVEEPIDEDNRIQFLYYFMQYHLMNVNDRDSIERKIIRAVMEYED